MNPINFFKKAFGKKSYHGFNTYNGAVTNPLGTHLPRAYEYYRENQYDNSYASIRVIANEFLMIQPYAIDSNGKQVESNIIDKLYHPNQKMSAARFREALAIMQLIHPKTYLLAWHIEGGEAVPGGEITVDNIAGYTFLEGVSEHVAGGEISYQVGNRRYTDKEVLTFSGINPQDLSKGYSPAMSIRKYASLDDCLVDYQRGFFENGAVPSGQFVITAPTVADFNDMVDTLQERHRGAGKNNNVTYTHRPIDPNTNKPVDAQIEWVPFNQSNKDLSLKDIFTQVANKIDSAYGVPSSVRGVNEQNTYASVRVDEVILAKYVINPFALLTWGDFTHGMNYITGGMGIAITYEYEVPHIAEEEKIIAEKKKIEVDMILALVGQGFSLDSAVDSLELPNSYKLLKVGSGTTATIDNDKPEVDEGEETIGSPNPNSLDPYKKSKEAAKRTNPKEKKELSESNKDAYVEQIAEVATKFMRQQVERAIKNTKAIGDPTEEEKQEFIDSMTRVISAILLAGGKAQYEEGRQILFYAGINFDVQIPYIVSDDAIKRYRAYVKTIADSYSDDTSKSIRAVLDIANTNGWTRVETDNALRNIMNTDEYRVKRLSISEVNRSGGMSSVEAMRKIQDDAGVRVEKTMLHTGNDPICEYCAARLGVWYPVDAVMVEKGSTLEGVEGGVIINNWDDNEGHDIHANGHCVPTYRVVR